MVKNVDTVISSPSPRVLISVAESRDASAIARFTRRLSAASRRSRRFGNRKANEVTPNEGAITVIARDRDSGIVVGHAVAFPGRDGAAELELAVADAYQHHRIGTLLLERILQEARRRGVRAFHADLLASNRRMLDMIAREGYALIAEQDVATQEVVASIN
jgi:GNAT superfamily N-acetyltransferase